MTGATISEIALTSPRGFNRFRVALAERIQKLLPRGEVKEIIELLEAPKNPEHGDFALPMPRVMKMADLKGSPIELAKKWANEVSFGYTLILLPGIA